MDEMSVIRAIVDECLNPEGFLIQFHSHNTFNLQRYQQLIQNIHAYKTILGDRDTINRQVAGCIFAISEEFQNHIVLGKNQNIEDSYAEFLDLTNDIIRI